MDVIGPISPQKSKEHRLILAIIDYFSKWAKAIPLKEVKTADVIKIVKHHVIYRFGVPRRIMIMDPNSSAKHFRDSTINSNPKYVFNSIIFSCQRSCRSFQQDHQQTSQEDRLKSQHDWDERLGECLWAYRARVRTPTKTTPFSLVCGCKAVLPLEIQIPSLRVVMATEMTNEEKYQLYLQELEDLDDKRLQAQQQIELYQARIFRAFNKKSRSEFSRKATLS